MRKQKGKDDNTTKSSFTIGYPNYTLYLFAGKISCLSISQVHTIDKIMKDKQACHSALLR